MEKWPKRKRISGMSQLLDIDDLTPSERLFFWRQRRKLFAWQAAKICRVTLKRYLMWEGGRGDVPLLPLASPLENHEACYMIRKRQGMRQGELAKNLKLSRIWINRMELGKEDCTRLVEYWEGVGIT